jgi:hypothetical protein
MAGQPSVSIMIKPTFHCHRLTIITAIHGDKQQNERDWVLDQFKTNKSPIMVATDVASRGIGMYHVSPLPSNGNFQRNLCCALLSCLGALLTARTCLTFPCPLGSPIRGALIRCVAPALLYVVFRSCTLDHSRGYERGGDIS